MDASLSATPLSFLFLTLLLLSSFLPATPFAASPSLATSVRCNKDDYTALMKIKGALQNPYLLASWVRNTDCCGWYLVECDENTNRIIQLGLYKDNFSGQIPTQVGDLPYLRNLAFSRLPNLSGTIPSTVAKLKSLKFLLISRTSVSGPIPSFLGQLHNLEFLSLSFNNFSGSIPSSLSSLPKLTALQLDSNSLTGEIPESFGKFKQTVSLTISRNQLSGEIPKSLGDVDFDTIDLGRNKLRGDASMLFKANGSAAIINLDRNMFEFDLSKVGIANNLQHLDISHNSIYGSIPGAITRLVLQNLNVSFNQLCGKIPQGGRVQNFDSYSFLHNKCLCGSPLAACK